MEMGDILQQVVNLNSKSYFIRENISPKVQTSPLHIAWLSSNTYTEAQFWKEYIIGV
jgi:hypothetical protein